MADYGHNVTDKMLGKAEGFIEYEYNIAMKQIKKKLDAYLKQFKESDKQKKALVKQGLLSKDDYNKWRLGKMATGKRWEDMKDVLAQDFANANAIARHIVGEHMKDVYAFNFNYGTYEVERGANANLSFTLYDHAAVERIIRDKPDILPQPGKKTQQKIAEGKAKKWSKRELQSVMTQAILQGESIPNIAKRLVKSVGEMEKSAAIRNARTMTTTAENAGREDSYKRAVDMGVEMKQMWLATLDSRTRHGHRLLDGQMREVGKPFEVEGFKIAYPGDITAPGHLVYNCRCRLIAAVKGSDLYDKGLEAMDFRHSKLNGQDYNAWKHEHEQKGSGAQKKMRDWGTPFIEINAKYKNGALELIENAPEFTQDTWERARDELLGPVFDLKDGAHYNSKDGRTHYESEKEAYEESSYQEAYTTFFHEYGHNIDNILGRQKYGGKYDYLSEKFEDGAFPKALKKDIENALREFYKSRNNNYLDVDTLSDYDVLEKYSKMPGAMELDSLLKQFASAHRVDKGREWTRQVRQEIIEASEKDGDYRRIIDKYFKGDKYLESELRDQRNFLKRHYDKSLESDNAMEFAKAVKKNFSLYERCDVADMFDAYYCWNYGKGFVFGVGHGKDYFGYKDTANEYKNLRTSSVEAFAEMYSATVLQGKSLPVIKQFFPESYEIFKRMIGG